MTEECKPCQCQMSMCKQRVSIGGGGLASLHSTAAAFYYWDLVSHRHTLYRNMFMSSKLFHVRKCLHAYFAKPDVRRRTRARELQNPLTCHHKKMAFRLLPTKPQKMSPQYGRGWWPLNCRCVTSARGWGWLVNRICVTTVRGGVEGVMTNVY